MRPRTHTRLTATIASLAVAFGCLFLFGPAPAEASEPDPFYGVMAQDPMSSNDFDTMKWGRLGAYRLPIAWQSVESADGEMDWSTVDRIMAATASRGIDLLPVLYRTPEWLWPDRRRLPVWNSNAIGRWKVFLKAALLRYGTDGAFWDEHPGIPVRPVIGWQIWNEPNIRNFAWPVSVKRYARLLKISDRVIDNFDPDGRTVLGGLYARVSKQSGMDAGPFLKRSYRIRGFRSSFDIGAIHPYAGTTRQSIRRSYSVRKVMNRHGNRSRKLLVTEMGWGSDSATIFGKGDQQDQGTQLTSAYRAFLRNKARLNLGGVYWFSWGDLAPGTPGCSFCLETGLFDSQGRAKPAWYRLLDFTHDL